MDPVTHGLFGAIAGVSVWRLSRGPSRANTQTSVSRKTNNAHGLSKHHALGIGALAGMFPDIDIVTYFFNPLYYNAYWHGTYTHSIVLAPLWAGLLTLIFVWLGRSVSRQPSSPSLVFIICLAAISTHIGADLITAWDIGLFMPLFDTRVSLGILFVIDPLFTLLTTLLLIALVCPWSRGLAVLSLCLFLAWIAVASGYKHQALELARDSLPDELEAPEQAQLKAWPQPFALSHWKLVYQTHDGIWSADVRLSHRPALDWPLSWLNRSAAAYETPDNLSWHFRPQHPTALIEAAWNQRELYAVRDFMTYPVFLRQDSEGCIWFTDWLFVIPEQEPPFQYAACQSPEGDWQVKRAQVPLPWQQHSK